MLPRCLMLLGAGKFKESKWPVSWNLISNYLLCRFISHLSVDLLGISTFFCGTAAFSHALLSVVIHIPSHFLSVFHCRLFPDYLKFAPLFCGTLPRRWRNKLIKKFFQIESREKLLHTHHPPRHLDKLRWKNQSLYLWLPIVGRKTFQIFYIFQFLHH